MSNGFRFFEKELFLYSRTEALHIGLRNNMNTCFLFVYRLIYLFGFFLYLPVLLWSKVVRKKEGCFFQRLFFTPKECVDGPILWVHAVSVGETMAIAPMVRAFEKRYPSWKVVFSNVTKTGHETAKKLFPGACSHLLLPFDFKHSVRRVMKKLSPSLVVLSEGDVWPLFLHEARQCGAPVVIVNGKISHTSFSRLKRFSWIGKWLYSFIDFFCVQSALFYDRLCALGVPEEKLSITGNIKADVQIDELTQEQKREWRERLGLREGDELLVVGSTHEPEEKEIVTALSPLCTKRPNFKIAIVPRHPERFDEVYEQMRSIVSNVERFSEGPSGSKWSVMVIDALGQLCALYGLSTISIVAGSFVERVGGHNILEPAAVSVPVIVGPYMHSQHTLFSSAQESGAVISSTIETLPQLVEDLLEDKDKASMAASKARVWADTLRGATDRSLDALSQFLP